MISLARSVPAAAAPTARLTRRAYLWAIIGVLALAGAWRAWLATQMPVLSRDGVTFLWYAQALGEHGISYLRSPDAQQHPLYPLLILCTQQVAAGLGAPNTPLVWQRCGQLVSGTSGMAVVALVGAITARLARQLDLPIHRSSAVLLAMLFAALLDLNLWLSADVMSDEVHLAFYLAAVWLLIGAQALAPMACAGLCGGLAFLTRQEGFVPVLAGLGAVVFSRPTEPAPNMPRAATAIDGRARARLLHAAALLATFLIVAAPYWFIVGRFSTKKDPFQAFRQETAAASMRTDVGALPGAPFSPSTTATARLETVDFSWYALVPHAFYKLLRAGRVVVPLLALLPWIELRRRYRLPALAPVVLCAILHFCIVLVLLDRYGYLATRHMLVIVLLLAPFAAFLLARLLHLMLDLKRASLAVLVVVVTFLPLLAYAGRVPNSGEAYLADAVAWLQQHDPALRNKTLLSGSGPKRIAFYTAMRWCYWPEDPNDPAFLSGQIHDLGAGYFALETGPGFERAGNAQLLQRLRSDPALTLLIRNVHVRPGPRPAITLHLLEIAPR